MEGADLHRVRALWGVSMSATGRNLAGHERAEDDFYETPHWATRAILPHLQRGASVLDPCCGLGAILDVARGSWQTTCGIEIGAWRAKKAAARGHEVVRRDALSAGAWPNAFTIVTNPPYSLAEDFIRRAWQEAPNSDAAFLLRLNFLGAQKRAAFHRRRPADVFLLPRRPSFVLAVSCKGRCGWGELIPLRPDTGKPTWDRPARCNACGDRVTASSSDACEYAWFVWGPNRGGRWQILEATP